MIDHQLARQRNVVPPMIKVTGDRRRYEQAHDAGRWAAIDGKSAHDCPYPKTPSFRVMREGWYSGFQAGGGRLIT